jgi:hypothetical protein
MFLEFGFGIIKVEPKGEPKLKKEQYQRMGIINQYWYG